jgi:DNA-binding NarL/FixJ family response regulator
VTQPLSEREIDVVFMLSEGMTNIEIGHALDIKPLTVKSHLAHIAAKLELPNGGDRAGIVGHCFRTGILPLYVRTSA